MPTLDELKRAIAISEQIETLKEELSEVLSGNGGSSAKIQANRIGNGRVAKTAKSKAGKRNMSPEARARIVAAQKARWAKVRGEKLPVAVESKSKPAKKGKRVVSEEARARMAESAKKRWAKKN